MKSIRDEFLHQMRIAGLESNDTIIADGQLHRIHILGDRKGTRNGWYILFPDFPAVGIFGCWKRSIKVKWLPQQSSIMTIADTRKRNERLQAIDCRCKLAFATEWAARQEALLLWQASPPASNRHAYLIGKKVRSHGIRYNNGALLIPVRDSDNTFHGLQRIWPKGGKRYYKGTIVTGHFHLIGTMNTGALLLCEGYATGATLFEVTGHSIAVCFNSHNLMPAATAIRTAWPKQNIMVCADDDHADPKNPGLTAAITAANAINAKLVVPVFHTLRTQYDTDFNDLFLLSGPETVRRCFQQGGACHV